MKNMDGINDHIVQSSMSIVKAEDCNDVAKNIIVKSPNPNQNPYFELQLV